METPPKSKIEIYFLLAFGSELTLDFQIKINQ